MPGALGVRRDPCGGALSPPSETTIRWALAGTDAAALDEQVSAWLAAWAPGGDDGPPDVAVDGKAVRGAVQADGRAVHLLAAMTSSGAVLAQRDVEHKTNETTQVKPLPGPLELTGAVAPGAMHAQRETTRYLVEDKKADYIFTAIKENQPMLFRRLDAIDWAAVPIGHHMHDSDLRNRGVRDILIACCDGLSGFEDAIHSAFPATTVQRCVVHLIRNSLRPVARKDAAEVAGQLRRIYTAPNEEAALEALAAFAASPLGQRHPQAVRVWEDAWDTFIPFLAFTPPVRALLYTTNSIESLNYQLRKVTKACGHFPSDDAVIKLLWLAIVNIEDKRAREHAARRAAPSSDKRHDQPCRLIEGQRTIGWREALTELTTAYPGRIS